MTDAFTTTARAEAARANGATDWDRDCFVSGAEWARDHLAAEIRKAQADAWQAGVNFALPRAETTHFARHNPHRTEEDA